MHSWNQRKTVFFPFSVRALEVLKPITPDYDVNDTTTTSEDDINAELKSPISLVHEMALKRDLTVTFEVLSEKGPPHMKIFVTACTVGDITVSAILYFHKCKRNEICFIKTD